MDYLVYLVKNEASIGVVRYQGGTRFLSEVFENVSKMLVNYNKRLISEELPNEVLAHRFFEKSDVELSDIKKYARNAAQILGISYSYLKDKYKDYDWGDKTDQSADNGIMAFVPMDILNLMNPVGMRRVQINLDKKTVGFYNFFGKMSKEEYCKKADIDETKFNETKFPVARVEEFSFNEYEEMTDFIERNLMWKDPEYDLIRIR